MVLKFSGQIIKLSEIIKIEVQIFGYFHKKTTPINPFFQMKNRICAPVSSFIIRGNASEKEN
jgi:hypothetical protein